MRKGVERHVVVVVVVVQRLLTMHFWQDWVLQPRATAVGIVKVTVVATAAATVAVIVEVASMVETMALPLVVSDEPRKYMVHRSGTAGQMRLPRILLVSLRDRVSLSDAHFLQILFNMALCLERSHSSFVITTTTPIFFPLLVCISQIRR